MGSIMDAAGWSGFAGLRADTSANGHDVSTVGQEAPSVAAPESNISLERLQRRLSRLAFDVHDGPLQELAALGYELSNLRNRTTRSSSPDPDLDGEFERMMSQLASVEGMLRSMMFAMEEGAAASSDLELVVEQQVDAFRALSPGRPSTFRRRETLGFTPTRSGSSSTAFCANPFRTSPGTLQRAGS